MRQFILLVQDKYLTGEFRSEFNIRKGKDVLVQTWIC